MGIYDTNMYDQYPQDEDDGQSGWFEGDDESEDDFADPGGHSSLRAAGPNNPRNLPCPTCGTPNVLTPKDRNLGYQCNACADRAEGRGYGRSDY